MEGYSADFKQQFGGPGRVDILKSGVKVQRDQIPDYFKDKQALADVESFIIWKRLGFPRANWEECPNRYVQVVYALKPIDDLYNPPQKLL